jgi:hypothetical protein
MYYSSNVQSHSEMSSNRSTPLGFEQSLWAHPDSVTHVEGISSDFVSTMVDEFLQLDTMKDANVSLRSFGQNKLIRSPDMFDPLAPSIPAAFQNVNIPEGPH